LVEGAMVSSLCQAKIAAAANATISVIRTARRRPRGRAPSTTPAAASRTASRLSASFVAGTRFLARRFARINRHFNSRPGVRQADPTSACHHLPNNMLQSGNRWVVSRLMV
jgi:hypothetical protein